LPAHQVLSLLDHGQRLMAHLSLVRLSLAGPWVAAAGPVLTGSLSQAHAALSRLLADPAASSTETADGNMAAPTPGTGIDGLDALPLTAPEQDGMPWLQRRLGVLQKDALAVQQAAWALSRPHR